MCEKQYPTVEEFLMDRIREVEGSLNAISLWYHPEIAKPLKVFFETQKKLIEWHKQFPIMVETPLIFNEPPFPEDPEAITYEIHKRIEWLTRIEYMKRFGKEAPTAPFLREMLEQYVDHPDFNPKWRGNADDHQSSAS